jgi:5'(3')-deoxyribonucleotidase
MINNSYAFSKEYVGTILFDMDEVLAQFMPAWMGIYNNAYGDNLQVEQINDWDTTKFVKPECGQNIYELLKVPGLFRYLKPAPHSQEVLQRLVDKGYDVVVVSDSPQGDAHCDFTLDDTKVGNPADDKRKWLQEHFPMIDKKNVVFTAQKWRVMGDVLVDDKPETYEIFNAKGRDCLLVDMPYNRYIQTDLRVGNLLEAEKWIYDKFETNNK